MAWKCHSQNGYTFCRFLWNGQLKLEINSESYTKTWNWWAANGFCTGLMTEWMNWMDGTFEGRREPKEPNRNSQTGMKKLF
jgi:hypothetical protein